MFRRRPVNREAAFAVMTFQLLEQTETRFENLGALRQPLVAGQFEFVVAQEFQQAIGDRPAGIAHLPWCQNPGELIGRAAKQTLLIDEGDSHRNHVLASTPAKNVMGATTKCSPQQRYLNRRVTIGQIRRRLLRLAQTIRLRHQQNLISTCFSVCWRGKRE
jgi:hypothetical protein